MEESAGTEMVLDSSDCEAAGTFEKEEGALEAEEQAGLSGVVSGLVKGKCSVGVVMRSQVKKATVDEREGEEHDIQIANSSD